MSMLRAPRRVRSGAACVAAGLLAVAIACAAPGPRAFLTSAGPIPAKLAGATLPRPQYYPRAARIDTVDDAGCAWIRAALARYYPRVLAGDTSLAFITLYVSADGRIVGAAARRVAEIGPDTVDAPFPFDSGAYAFGKNAPAADAARVAADSAAFKTDLDTMFRSQVPTASVLGTRFTLPREFTFDSLRAVAPNDPFLGANPHAFQRMDEIAFKPGVVAPNEISVVLLTLLPGRGGPSDFGHHVVLRTTPITPAPPPPPQPDIEHLGDLPGGGWAVTPDVWATLTHKAVILIDGVVRSFDALMALTAHSDSIVSVKRVPSASAMQLTRDTAAAYGAIVVTTTRRR